MHGTWGRGFFVPRSKSSGKPEPSGSHGEPHWFEKGSQFQNKLLAELVRQGYQVEFDYFLWSGDNSFLQREQAAKELEKLLRSQSERFPGSKKVVIAHSHGGNVLLRAVDMLGNKGDAYHLITLATPFVQIEKGNVSPFSYLAAKFALGAVTVAIGSVGMIVGAISLMGVFVEPSIKKVAVAILSILLAVLAMKTSRKTNMFAQWFTGQSAEKDGLSRDILKLCSASSLPARLSRQPLLVLRGVDDEAALTLAAGSIGARLSRLILAVLDNLVAVSLLGVVFVVIPAIVITGVLSDIVGEKWSLVDWLFYSLLGSGGMILVGFPLLITAIAFISNLFKSVFGRELLHGGISLDVISNSTPDFIGNVDAITLPSPKHGNGGMRHSLHAHPHVEKTIALWLSAKNKGDMTDLYRYVGKLRSEQTLNDA